MPVIVDPQGIDGGIVTIAQSGAILIYLAEKMGAGLPTVGRARTAALQWLMHVLTDTNAISSSLHLSNNKVPEKHAPTIAALEERLLTFLRDCDQVLQCDAYLAGELSIADFALYPLVANRRSWIDQQTGLDQLRQWADALARRPSVAKGMQFHLNSSRNTLPTQTLPTISATLSKAKMQQPGPFMWS
jgi:GST-like protein